VPSIPFVCLSVVAGLVTRWFENVGIGYKTRTLDLSLLDRCLVAGRAFWFQLSKLLWPSNLTFVYPRWEINATVWWQYLFPLAVLVLLGVLWSLRRWSRGPLAGVVVYIFFFFSNVGFFYLFFFLFFFVFCHLAYLSWPRILFSC